MKQSLLNSILILICMIGYALALKLFSAETSGTYLYYVIFGLGAMISTWRLQSDRSGWQTFGLSTLAIVISVAGYGGWILFNTFLIIDGPIPTLVLALEQATDQKSTAAVQRFIDSPALFAANTAVVLFIFGMVITIATRVTGYIWQRKQEKLRLV